MRIPAIHSAQYVGGPNYLEVRKYEVTRFSSSTNSNHLRKSGHSKFLCPQTHGMLRTNIDNEKINTVAMLDSSRLYVWKNA